MKRRSQWNVIIWTAMGDMRSLECLYKNLIGQTLDL